MSSKSNCNNSSISTKTIQRLSGKDLRVTQDRVAHKNRSPFQLATKLEMLSLAKIRHTEIERGSSTHNLYLLKREEEEEMEIYDNLQPAIDIWYMPVIGGR